VTHVANTLGAAMTRIDEFDYDLPQERIAQTPLADRSASKLLIDRGSLPADHRTVAELDQVLQPGDLLVVNDTRVLAARIFARRPTGGVTEVLLLEPQGPAALALRSEISQWQVLVKPSKKVPPGTELEIDGESELVITIGEDLGAGRRQAQIQSSNLEAALERVGNMPLPPYITVNLDDPERYQTVYAEHPGSAAAPTAGLHLTDELLGRLETRGVSFARVELVVGLDTFRPVTAERLDDHHMHSERYRVPAATAEAVEAAKRVVAVGTTTVRALESAARFGPEGATNLFIRRPFDFSVVDLVLTNFHMPKSTLLVMIDALVGPRWRDLYAEALASDYRFLSFGDAMLLDRNAP
jgi:S-adenosylmethionine:tRNA ribosyltransferase-isomerase